ncbi:MAG: Na/Pi cotransporter family protein [Muribaculaceae bacterium]|nr:Na/Pi cotransporter family protein [Muribaculaceae bacterium]
MEHHSHLLTLLNLIGALGLLIYGMKMMSEALQKMAGAQLRHILSAMTTNRFMGLLTGTFVTCAVQSSSATTVMTVSFVSAGLLTLSQAITIIMGANIGTTLTAWILTLGYNVNLADIAFPAFFVGIIFIYKKRYENAGNFLFGIAFMLLSLVMMSESGKALDLAHNESVIHFFSSFDTSSYSSVLIFLLVGTVITCIVQSSAAVMAITILLCSTGVLPIYLGVALVMGENIGTTATANIAALGAGTEARRAALAHLLFNVFGVVWVLCVFYPFVNLVCMLSGYDPQGVGDASRLPIVLAMFHTCFNVLNTALLIGFTPQLERLVRWCISDSQATEPQVELKYIQSKLVLTPELSLLQANRETQHLGERVQDMYGMVERLMASSGKEFGKLYEQIQDEEDMIDRIEISIANFLGHITQDHPSSESKVAIQTMLREISELESIGDSCFKLARIMKRLRDVNVHFSAVQTHNLAEMDILLYHALVEMNKVLVTPAQQATIQASMRLEEEINHRRDMLKMEDITSAGTATHDFRASSFYQEFVNECERLGDYIVNVVEAHIEPSLIQAAQNVTR